MKIFLFGSRVKGNIKENSDYDILVLTGIELVGKENALSFEIDSAFMKKINWDYNFIKEHVILSLPEIPKEKMDIFVHFHYNGSEQYRQLKWGETGFLGWLTRFPIPHKLLRR